MGNCTFTPAARTVANGTLPAGLGSQGVTDLGRRFVEGTLALSSSYATGGDSIVMTDLPIREVDEMYVVADTANTSGLSYVLVSGTSPKVKAYDSNGTEVTASTNLSTRNAVRVRLVGR